MAGTFRRCGHPRTEENMTPGGRTRHCITCRDAKIAERKQARIDRDRLIAEMVVFEKVDVKEVARRFGFQVGTIKRIVAESGLVSTEIETDPTFPLRAIRTAAELAGANPAQLCSDWRAPKILVHARWAVMAAWMRRGGSYSAIGRRLNRDHTTIMYGVRQAQYLAERSPDFRDLLDKVDAA